ncbi:hypothetical protein [Lysinibacillus halotolerans]|uniref:Uncharacterized protein n=1 Tax=Lysinibacillus halotolerans TaxID=1368476 RepID=A0A3M8GYD9_9BACI|nr:hypothetical protein [Lysinibacillus halotolerans]RNC95362.1 hypothetical protein EC501_18260 [Lysinibacillus halotolerans]
MQSSAFLFCHTQECKYCPKFVFSPAINEREEAIKWLSDLSKHLEEKIHESIELMKDLSNSLASTFRQGNSDLLKSTSKQLVTYMDQKVIIEYALMETNDYE